MHVLTLYILEKCVLGVSMCLPHGSNKITNFTLGKLIVDGVSTLLASIFSKLQLHISKTNYNILQKIFQGTNNMKHV